MDKILEPKFNTLGYFILSSILYICIVFSIFFQLTSPRQEAKKYTDTKDAFMDIMIVERELDTTVKAPEKKDEVIKAEEPVKKEEEIKKEEPKSDTTNKPVEPETVPEPKPAEPEVVEKKEEPSLKDLFKDIDISKLKEDEVAKKKEPPKEQSRKKPEKTQAQGSQKKASDIISALTLDKVAKTPKSQMTGEYNPYFGQVTRILQTKWSTYKADSNDNAVVQISIDVNGNFSYDIKQLSYNSEFNDKVRDFLQSMTFEKFPPPTDGKVFSIQIKLEDKLE